MVEPIFETLVLLGNLSIALISVIIAVYSLAITFLGRETRRIIWSLEKREVDLERRFKRDEFNIEKFDEERGNLKKEKKNIENRLFFLKVNGSVFIPLVVFATSLLSALTGIYLYPSYYSTIALYLSIIFLVGGFTFVLKVIKTVEWAASRIPMPSFNVTFSPLLKNKKIKLNEFVDISFGIENTGEVLAEDLEVRINFPQGVKIQPTEFYSLSVQPEGTDFEGYTSAIFRIDRIYQNISNESPPIKVKSEIIKKHPIPIRVYERNVGFSEHKLILEVIE